MVGRRNGLREFCRRRNPLRRGLGFCLKGGMGAEMGEAYPEADHDCGEGGEEG